LTNVVAPETVKLGLEGLDKRQAIEALVDLVVASGKGTDRETILSAVLDREAKGSTGLENGIAIPHARTPGVADVVCALGISRAGIDFDSVDGKPCHLVFLIVAPPEESTGYLKALAAVALIGRDPDTVPKLRSAGSPAEVMVVLAEAGGTISWPDTDGAGA
jgi:mannitol/fructose-specific phosphotransferase system IIA component (Ntr-type)